MQDHRWQITLFGGLSARCGDHVIPRFGVQKAGALLAYLAFRVGERQPREKIAEVLWPEEDGEGIDEVVIRSRFRYALCRLKEALTIPMLPVERVLIASRSDVVLNAECVTTDVAEFREALYRAGETADPCGRILHLQHAVQFYRGPLLAGCYEEWIASEQAFLSDVYRAALMRLAEDLGACGRAEEAIEPARRAIAEDPLWSAAHCLLMRLFAQTGRFADLKRQYSEMVRVLQTELDLAPDAQAQNLYRQLMAQAMVNTPVPPPSGPVEDVRPRTWLEPEGGAVPLDSTFYIVRPTDAEFEQAIGRRDSIVLVKGPRQVGKTSLLARGLQHARDQGRRVVFTDLQKLNAQHLASIDALLLNLADGICDQLGLDTDPAGDWHPRRGSNENLERFLRHHALAADAQPLVWGLDEVDRLFGCEFRSEVFGLFRSWHNQRVCEPTGPWQNLTLAVAYATEAHLLISDLNQSPFNVGTRLLLHDFAREEVEELNRRYHAPLQDARALNRLYALLGGNPYLVRRGLHYLAETDAGVEALEAEADAEDGLFADHLRGMARALLADEELCEAVRSILRGQPCPSSGSFYRLHSAGVITGRSLQDARPRCLLYEAFLKRSLL